MIRVERVDEPPKFDVDCRQPGKAWIDQHPNSHPRRHPLWGAFRGDLRASFHGRCGFLGHWIHSGTVDHWESLKNRPELAYEWSNYRYVANEINSAKKPAWDGKLIDPFEIPGDWFEIQLPSMQLAFVGEAPAEIRARVEFTLDKLHLRHGEEVIRTRREWMKQYESGGLSLSALHHIFPLLARAIAKRDGIALGLG